MNRILLLVAALLIASLAGLVSAQDFAEPSFDPRVWFGSAAGLAALVFALVGLLKSHVFKTITGIAVLALSYGLGVGIAVVGSFTTYFEASLFEAVMFGITASTLASGGWDSVKDVLERALGKASA